MDSFFTYEQPKHQEELKLPSKETNLFLQFAAAGNTQKVRQSKQLVKTKDKNGYTVLNNRYRLVSKLGQGSQAKVKLGMLIEELFDENYEPQYFAVKIYLKPYLKKQRSFNRSSSSTSGGSSVGSRGRRSFCYTTALDEVYREIEIMKKIDHPNIIRLIEIIDDPDNDKLYLIMPVVDYGQVLEWEPKNMRFLPNHKLQAKNVSKAHKIHPEDAIFYNEDSIRKMARQLIDALNYLHSELNIVHRDIKHQNIMVDQESNLILCDFGKSQQLLTEDDDRTTTIQGTYSFLPPESCSFDHNEYSMKKADVWALGVTIYILTFNRLPFGIGHNQIDLFENICNFELTFEGRDLSPDLQELLILMLQKDPNMRPSASDLVKFKFIQNDYSRQSSYNVTMHDEEKLVVHQHPFFKKSDSFYMTSSKKLSISLFKCDGGDSPKVADEDFQNFEDAFL